MKKINNDGYYQGFSHPCKDLVKFANALGIFTIMLKNGSIIHFQPDNIANFKQWLLENNIEDIKAPVSQS
ncbi:MAG: hypothetical protein QM594_20080 [Niabella sp.]